MPFRSHASVLLLSLVASPALAVSDATEIPPPPNLVQPVTVLLVFLAIFVGAAWSLSALMGISAPPVGAKLWRRRRSRF